MQKRIVCLSSDGYGVGGPHHLCLSEGFLYVLTWSKSLGSEEKILLPKLSADFVQEAKVQLSLRIEKEMMDEIRRVHDQQVQRSVDEDREPPTMNETCRMLFRKGLRDTNTT